MKVVSLVENTTCQPACGCTHGLSLYIETPEHTILFDMGPDDLFLENAKKLELNLKQVDLAFLSHGHYDHGGGLEAFCRFNLHATVFLSDLAFGEYYSQEPDGIQFVGLYENVRDRFDVRFRSFCGEIDEELTLFNDVTGTALLSKSNETLLEKVGENEYRPDPFLHERHLLISCEGKHVLFAGCAHRGIVNVLQRAEELVGGELDWVFSGFHLFGPDEPEEQITAIGKALAQRRKTRYVTGHCTGEGPFALLHAQLEDRLQAMPVGSTFLL